VSENEERCHCGRLLHYNSPMVERLMRKLVDEYGRYATMVHADSGRTFLVDKHFIALHGITGAELLTGGFREIEPEDPPR
jgi:hypothetical protein